ncbi:MAG: hypothetical protein EXR72_18055 [Myxococcales bacterium]|nr:hypothetical protein [Myxococcales bacterium]
MRPEYHLAYALSPQLAWAWRRVRSLDGLRNLLADLPDGEALSDTIEVRWNLPEGLPQQPLPKR